MRSSLHLGRPCFLVQSLGIHSVALMVQRLSDNRAMLPAHLCFSFLIALMSFDDISYASFLPDPGVQFGEIHIQRLPGDFLKNVFMTFSCCRSAKLMTESPLLLPVSSPNAAVQDFDGSPEPTLALKSPTMMKMGLAIGDEVIHVLINYIYSFI